MWWETRGGEEEAEGERPEQGETDKSLLLGGEKREKQASAQLDLFSGLVSVAKSMAVQNSHSQRTCKTLPSNVKPVMAVL